MDFELTALPILAHRYVPRYVKVGPPIEFNPAVQQAAHQAVGG